eukprot:CAMPEP_0119558934 /NCGR_PEP_ID=MMETSP1352-20130426/11644_1 /TAXON_ID=265584 /ORGANISM="Stauroneis constricta, Strain CCMP1120" /LENGTH=80 /DNA_ID=CAMNT_0007606447 /DNA_START=47 /DNA_END=286 /DNA_ORIENTATION=+
MDSDNFAAPDGSATHFRGNSQNRRQRSTAAAVDHHHNNDNEHDDKNGPRGSRTEQQNHHPYQLHQHSGAFITRTAAPTAA